MLLPAALLASFATSAALADAIVESTTQVPIPAPASAPKYADVEMVHVINSCHLDIGFADSSQGIINRYFTHHFPMAVTVGKELRAAAQGRDVPDKLNFMFQSWVISMYLDCPPGLGLVCPNTTQVADFEAAVRAGDVTWHAFPHNAELQMMDPALLEAGLALTWGLDDKFGLPHKSTLSQRDVPGMTRALVPFLSKAGVAAISIGANDGSTPPSVPKVFKWVDAATNTSLLGLLNWPGYGSLHNGPVLVNGTKHALVYNWNGDNAGPSTSSAYLSTFASLGKQFPNATIASSTFDAFTAQVLPLVGDPKSVPVMTEEMGDTWVYGVPSDPQKVARMRVINRAWRDEAKRWPGGSILQALKIRAAATAATASNTNTTASNEQPFQAIDYVLWNATRFALKNGEHTWGKDVKSNLYDNGNWTNPDFHKAKVPPSRTASQYAVLEDSWWEQREWGIATTMNTLIAGGHRMVDGLLEEFAALEPILPTPASLGFVEGAAGTTYRCGGEDVAFNTAGALRKLGSWVASDDRAVLQLKYRQYSNADVQEFFKSYCKSDASWVQHDYGKPDLPDTVPSAITAPTLIKLWVKTRGGGGGGDDVCEFAAELAFSAGASTDCGAPTVAWVNLTVTPSSSTPSSSSGPDSHSGPSAEVVMGLFNKTQTRLPEAMFLQFQPVHAGGKWFANKLGEWIGSTEIVDGGTKHLHGVTEKGIKFESADGKNVFTVASTDAGVANFGNLTAYPSPVHQDADVDTFGAGFVLWDNLWGTNYIMWWPFEQPPPQQYSESEKYFPAAWNDDMVSRYSLAW